MLVNLNVHTTWIIPRVRLRVCDLNNHLFMKLGQLTNLGCYMKIHFCSNVILGKSREHDLVTGFLPQVLFNLPTYLLRVIKNHLWRIWFFSVYWNNDSKLLLKISRSHYTAIIQPFWESGTSFQFSK